MPQVLKDEVRARILQGALEVFARDGVDAATMADIAKAAGIGTASIYRYYESKDELFAAVITPELARRFESLLDRRVSALARNTLRGESVDDAGSEMLRFWLENRLAVVILLEQPHSAERFVELLTKHTLAELRVQVTPRVRFVLSTIFDNTRRLLGRVLATYERPDELREAIEAFWSYQVAGLRGLTAHLA